MDDGAPVAPPLLLAQSLYGFQHCRFARWIKSSRYTRQRQRQHCSNRRYGYDLRGIETRWEFDTPEQVDDEHRAAYPDGAAQQCQERAFKKKLEKDAAVGRAQGFAQSDLARALGYGHEHDVHDA